VTCDGKYATDDEYAMMNEKRSMYDE